MPATQPSMGSGATNSGMLRPSLPRRWPTCLRLSSKRFHSENFRERRGSRRRVRGRRGRPSDSPRRPREIRAVGVVLIDFTEANHEYRVGARVLPSVTRILVGMGLLRTVDDEAALQRGRAAHEACRMSDFGTLVL